MSDKPTTTANAAAHNGCELPDRLLSKLKIEIEGYQLLESLGHGGQATVYRARQLKDGRMVAIKVLHAGPHADAEARARLKRETQALLALKHPNIVRPLAAGRTRSGLDCLVMNYIDGRQLDALWKDATFAESLTPEPAARLRLFKLICEIVQAAHLKGITHRDLSPSNILIGRNGQPYILDFGMASTGFDRLLGDGKDVTVTGQFIGKLKYASPEQARGSRDGVDIRTDVYALGVILYQILTDGAFPYEVVGNVIDVLNNIIHSKPRRPSDAIREGSVGVPPAPSEPRASASGKTEPQPTEPQPTEPRPSGSGFFARLLARHCGHRTQRLRSNPPLVNAAIEAIVLKALEKDPAARYQSAGELAADVDRYLSGLPTSAQSRRPPRRAWSRAGLVSIGIATTLILGGILMNARTLMTWFGFATAALPVMVAPSPSAVAAPQDAGAEKAAVSAADELVALEARLRAVTKQLSALGSDTPAIGGAPLDAAAFCDAIAKAAATEKPLAFRAVDRALSEQAEKEEAEHIKDANSERLVKLRKEYEDRQAALWARIAWGAIDSRKIGDKPLYRFKLKPASDASPAEKARRSVIEKGVTALRTADAAFRAAGEALKSQGKRGGATGGADGAKGDDEGESAGDADGAQSAAAQAMADAAAGMESAITAFAKAALDAADAEGIADADQTKIKEVEGAAKSLRAANKDAADSQEQLAGLDRVAERIAKRGSVQRGLIESVTEFATFDQRLDVATKGWGCEVERKLKFEEIRLTEAGNKSNSVAKTGEKKGGTNPAQKKRNLDQLFKSGNTWSGSRTGSGGHRYDVTCTVISKKGNIVTLECPGLKGPAEPGRHVLKLRIENTKVMLLEWGHRNMQGVQTAIKGGDGTLIDERLQFSCETTDFVNGKQTSGGFNGFDLTPD